MVRTPRARGKSARSPKKVEEPTQHAAEHWGSDDRRRPTEQQQQQTQSMFRPTDNDYDYDNNDDDDTRTDRLASPRSVASVSFSWVLWILLVVFVLVVVPIVSTFVTQVPFGRNTEMEQLFDALGFDGDRFGRANNINHPELWKILHAVQRAQRRGSATATDLQLIVQALAIDAEKPEAEFQNEELLNIIQAALLLEDVEEN